MVARPSLLPAPPRLRIQHAVDLFYPVDVDTKLGHAVDLGIVQSRDDVWPVKKVISSHEKMGAIETRADHTYKYFEITRQSVADSKARLSKLLVVSMTMKGMSFLQATKYRRVAVGL
ncbi:hypothetical protein ACSQ5K_16985 [Pseudomonas sp. PhalM4]